MPVPATRQNLLPPVGAGKGLPFTFLWADDLSDAGGAGTENFALFDTTLWAAKYPPFQAGPTPVTQVNAKAEVPAVTSNITTLQTGTNRLVPNVFYYPGATASTTAPRLSFSFGYEALGQTVQSIDAGRHATTLLQVRNTPTASTVTMSEQGRYVSHPRRSYTSARPGNMTWSQKGFNGPNHGANGDLCPAYDMQIGLRQAEDSEGDTGRTMGVAEAIAHDSATDIPSNGYGLSWGDAHDSLFHTTLWSCPIESASVSGVGWASSFNGDDPWATAAGRTGMNIESQSSAHWGINLAVRQHTLENGHTLSSPVANPLAGHTSGPVTWPAAEDTNLLPLAETIQVFAVNDDVTCAGTTPAADAQKSLGRADLGNFAVKDTAGLVGYEGIFVASAFFNVSANTDNGVTPDGFGTLNNDGAMTFAGINIQVHSGTGVRYNGMCYSDGDNDALFAAVTGAQAHGVRYGSDGEIVLPITEMLSTDCQRLENVGAGGLTANMSKQFTGRMWSLMDSPGAAPPTVLKTEPIEVTTGAAGTAPDKRATLTRFTKGYDGLIYGDAHDPTGGTKWEKTTHLTPAFMADRIPTKIKVVPVVVSWEEVTVTPGASKLTTHASAAPLKFRKPIVDYHVIVSMTSRERMQVRANNNNNPYGVATERNNVLPQVLGANLNLEDEPCYIYHAVFRINPTLEQVFYDASGCAWLSATGGMCQDSVMPRGNPSGDANNFRGWNLHQVTPFRPLANAGWNKVPKLCAAIEAGGTFQRGGIQHLWDADAYGGEVFVGADIIDTTDFTSTLSENSEFGTGQVWPIGSHSVTAPQGTELLIFRYDPNNDPFYTRAETTYLTAPFVDFLASTDFTKSEMIRPLAASFTGAFKNLISARSGIALSTIARAQIGWDIHDWVFPQIELMRYLGREDKAFARSPFHSGNTGSDPCYHPTLHCSSLRIMDDGTMMMAAIHRDYIGSEDEYPSSEIRYPFNPDAASGGCPPGYFQQGSSCIPITGVPHDTNPSNHQDPLTGAEVPNGPPQPITGDGTSPTESADNFSEWPTWSRIVANTSARSLLMMWTTAKAVNGKIPRAQAKFDVKTLRANGTDYLSQNWVTTKGHWWSGSRIAYWYQESAQRTIPITYGSYPESRCSFAHLPRCLPHIFGDTGEIRHGYPLRTPIDTVSPPPEGGTVVGRTGIDSWMTERYNYLVSSRFVPTTTGFSDFAAGQSPFQEMGWSGWSVARGLMDTIGYGDNTLFYSDCPASLNYSFGTAIPAAAITKQGLWENFGRKTGAMSGLMLGPKAYWTHHGPLHYGISTIAHPYKVDPVWKQVNGGVGYDIPLHLLAPGSVNVRARAGGRGSLDLEMETPFHRTDTLQLEGAAAVNSGFDQGGVSPPGASRTSVGQYYLRTNLWDNQARTQAANAKVVGLGSFQRVRGPIISGNSLSAWWTDHPTEHFHAGAMPVMFGNDYDLVTIESERYPVKMLARSDEFNELDMVAVSEQLRSSVDVHISQSVKPMWDSGSIVSAQCLGPGDARYGDRAPTDRADMDGAFLLSTAAQLTGATWTTGMGKGQKIIRTPDGTLHTFAIRRTGTDNTTPFPVWTHFVKPINNDLFWNRKAKKAGTSTATYGGKDEVGPKSTADTKLVGAAYASDSNGTIHAIIEVVEYSGATQGSHRLYYTYADRVLVTYNPEPTYEWDWTIHTPVALNPSDGAGVSDLRQPSLVIDGQDRLHLTCQNVTLAGIARSEIIYVSKTQEGAWPAWPVGGALDTDTRFQIVSYQYSDLAANMNDASEPTGHATQYNEWPKVTVNSEGTPFITWRGSCPDATGCHSGRTVPAIYTNRGDPPSSVNAPNSSFVFLPNRAACIMGSNFDVDYTWTYYDSIIDERDNHVVVGINQLNDATGLAMNPNVYLNSFSTRLPLADQFKDSVAVGTVAGVGVNKLVFTAKANAGNTLHTDTDYSDPTMTTDGQGSLHILMAFTLGGTLNTQYSGLTYRTVGGPESAVAPLQWGATPAPTYPTSGSTPVASSQYKGGYEVPAGGVTWSTGGLLASAYSGPRKHFVECYLPTTEVSLTSPPSGGFFALRALNVRWLSVPGIDYGGSTGWFPQASAQTMSGQEDFQHSCPQLRYQRYWGYDASELDLRWTTNELAWYRTPHGQSRVFFPDEGGMIMSIGLDRPAGAGIVGYPNGL